MSGLRVGFDFSLPFDAQTSTIVVYGGKGMGKTNFGSVLVEELAAQHLRFSVIDPLDVWWGLQHGRTKNQAGIEVLILGGPHGNLPINPSAGAIVADFVADEMVSTVVVLRHANGTMWSNAERIRFVADYFTRLYARQGEHRRPLMQVVDEAGRFVPQQMMKGDRDISECVGAIEQMVEWGRNVGVGVCLITQRSARMNKSVSELADCMIAFRTVGPNSIEAVVDWLGEHIPRTEQKDWVGKLRALDRGSALVVSPGWLSHEGVVRIRERQTFDSSKTPKPGESAAAPGKAVKPDLDKYQERMAATIEKAKADDPKELRRQIAELQKKVAAPAPAPSVVVDQAAIEKAVEEATTHLVRKVDELETLIQETATVIENLGMACSNTVEALRSVPTTAVRAMQAGASVGPPPSPPAPQPKAQPAPQPPREPRPERPPSEGVSGPQQRILNGLAELEAIGVPSVPRMLAALLAGYSHLNSKGFTNALGSARTAGLLDYPEPGRVALTSEGRSIAVADEPPRDLASLHERVMRFFDGPTQRVLAPLIACYPASMPRAALAEAAGYGHLNSKGFTNAVGRTKSLGLITYPSTGMVAATDVLFPEGLR